jgi:hypothetical protein
LRACQSLDHKTILARTVWLNSIVEGEFTENEMRKDFTPSERVAILETIERTPEGSTPRAQRNLRITTPGCRSNIPPETVHLQGRTPVLDADIRSFFDSVDHERLLRMLAHRIADPRILRLTRPRGANGSNPAFWPAFWPTFWPTFWKAMSGTRRTGERRRVPASARSWPTSCCITCSTSGSTNGAAGTLAVGYRSCAEPVLGPREARTRGPTTS